MQEENIDPALKKNLSMWNYNSNPCFCICIIQSDYLRKISLKLLSMESYANTQQNPGPGTIHNKSNITLCAVYIFIFIFYYKKKDYE